MGAPAAAREMPLGCLPAFKEVLPPLPRARLAALDEFDLGFLRPKIIEKGEGLIREETAELALRELKRFMSLPVLFPGKRVVPSAQVDVAWHQLILEMPTYRRLCIEVLGQPIDHIPRAPTDPRDDPDFAQTLENYRRAYGEPPAAIWAPVRLPPWPLPWPLVGLLASLAMLGMILLFTTRTNE